MQIRKHRQAACLTLSLNGRLDMATAPTLEAALELDGVSKIVFDLADCAYVSSAGIRVFLKSFKLMHAAGGRMELVGVSRDVREALEVTGLGKMLTIRAKARQISIDGLELLSAGFCGEVYRLDRESVVKLYNEGVAADLAEQEKEFAMAAFVAGIPTAISYDVVSCGARTGVVYEMLDAQTLTKIILRNLDDMDSHARLLADVLHTIHAVEGDPDVFPDLKTKLRSYIGMTAEFLLPADVALLQERLARVPDAQTCVHFDIHTNNIMVRDGEPLIIDMGDLSRGSYLFDVGLLHGIYAFPELGTCEIVTKIPNDKGAELWGGFVRHYFARRPPQDLAFFMRNRHFFAALRLIVSSSFLPGLREITRDLLQTVMLPGMRAAG